MGKTRGEIQKAYRERLKQKNNEEYLEKERQRRRINYMYVPSENLTKRERDKRNKQNRENLRHFYR